MIRRRPTKQELVESPRQLRQPQVTTIGPVYIEEVVRTADWCDWPEDWDAVYYWAPGGATASSWIVPGTFDPGQQTDA